MITQLEYGTHSKSVSYALLVKPRPLPLLSGSMVYHRCNNNSPTVSTGTGSLCDTTFGIISVSMAMMIRFRTACANTVLGGF